MNRLLNPAGRGAALATLLLVASCTAAAPSREAVEKAARIEAARATLAHALDSCSERFAFDPDAPDLPETGLAPDELAWRDCAYEAARDYAAVNTAMALDYATLIDQDREMTAALAAGEITRSERRRRLAPLIQAVHDKEAAQIEALGAAPESREVRARGAYELIRILP